MDEVWFVPCGERPDKPHLSTAEHRLKMTRLAVEEFFPEGFPVKIDTIEIEKGPSIPTIYLLDNYHKEYSDTEFLFVMGTELIAELDQWDEGERLINESKFLILERRGLEWRELTQHKNWPKHYTIVGTEGSQGLLGAISTHTVH